MTLRCGHHRQKLEDGTILPCAMPSCPDGLQAEDMTVEVDGHPRTYRRHATPQRISGGQVRTTYVWREEGKIL